MAALIKADERKLHAQVLLDKEFCDIDGICGAPIQLTSSGWRIAAHEPLTWHEQHRLQHAKQATAYVFDLAAKASGAPPPGGVVPSAIDGHGLTVPLPPMLASIRSEGFA